MPNASRERFGDLLALARKSAASDIHLLSGIPPTLRVAGDIVFAEGWPPMTRESLDAVAAAILRPEQRERLEREREICVSHFDANCGRLRVTFYHRLDSVELAIRLCQTEIMDAKTLGLPAAVNDLVMRTSGLFLVTGPTGSGKTTTLNYVIDAVNKSRSGKIITIEDPIEFEHSHRRSIVTQIEVGTDTLAFASFLRNVLRLDPDVIVIGEMRDLETISTALIGAETGHLVLATLHTPSAVGTAERIVSVFPGEQQMHTAQQVAATLAAVLSQRLVPTVDKTGRVLATEMMLATDAVRNMIRERSFHKLANAVQTGKSVGMHSLEHSLADLYARGIITRASAYAYANNIATMNQLLKHDAPEEYDE